MVLYRLHYPKTSNQNDVVIYSRLPEDITGLVNYYHRQYLSELSMQNNPNTGEWVKAPASLDSLVQVDYGEFIFETPAQTPAKSFAELEIAQDFVVWLAVHSANAFKSLQAQLPSCKRENLYKIQINFPPRPGTIFIPEDIAQGICSYDISRHSELMTGTDGF
jgi:hypothetical protein